MSAVITTLSLAACGDKSVLQSAEKRDPATEAARAMEQDRPEDAVATLRSALEKDPLNYQLRSLLSAALAQYYGIDAISLALKMAENKSGDSSSSNGIVALFVVLPDPTDETIAGLEEAIQELESIPEAERTRADNFKLSMMHTSLLGLRTKKFDLDLDGQISPTELLSLSDNDAAAILNSLISSQNAFNSGSASGQGSQAAGEKIGSIKGDIDLQDGATDSEKLRNYLSKDKK
jgi:hypothetical protein